MDQEPPSFAQAPRLRRPWARSARPIPARVIQPLAEFLHREATGGIILAASAVLALIWANLAPASYTGFWETHISVSLGAWGHSEDLRHVVNDGLMALFFFVIGLEVKRELTTGELSSRRAALLPLCAAAGGMLVPALIFVSLNAGTSGGEAARGWGVPMATDIAFALGMLALLGQRAPLALKALLLGIAVIDDIGAIIIVALFYTGKLSATWLLAAGALLGVMYVLQRVHVRALMPYVVLGFGVWLAVYESGVHATIAGVALGLLTPTTPFQRGDAVSIVAEQIATATKDDPDDPDKDARHWRSLAWLSREAASPLARLEHALHPWTSWVVLPLFALANVGIIIDRSAVQDVVTSSVGLGIVLGLVAGKPLGIILGSVLAVRLGLASLPDGVRWKHVLGIGAFAGIGFTMSLFIAQLAYSDPALGATSTMAVLVASVASALLGAIVLRTGRFRADG
jgi:NhaA family Na+:H+ antiporter